MYLKILKRMFFLLYFFFYFIFKICTVIIIVKKKDKMWISDFYFSVFGNNVIIKMNPLNSCLKKDVTFSLKKKKQQTTIL